MKNIKYLISVLIILSMPACFAFAEKPQINIVYPQGAEIFVKSQSYDITWDYSGSLTGNVSINLVYGDKGNICNVGSALVRTKKFTFNTDTAGLCKKILKDKEKYYLLLNYDNYYAPGSSYLNLSDKAANPVELRFDISDICGSANNGVFNSLPSSGLCNYGSVSEWPSVYVNPNACFATTATTDGNWKWKCSGVQCSANDPYKDLKLKFGATEIISLSGDAKNPESIAYWTENFCNEISPITGYDLVSCDSKDLNDSSQHGGGVCAKMHKVLVRRSIVCSQNYAPICGKNGKTYPNDCFAKRDNVEIGYAGSCTVKLDGICGSSNGKFFKSSPSTNLCQSGTASSVSKYSPWTWACVGVNGGGTAQCSADELKSKPVIEKQLSEMNRAELMDYLIKLLAKLNPPSL